MAKQQRTFGIIKPDAVAAGSAGKILAKIDESGLKIIAMKLMRLSEAQAQGFYAVHKERPFFGDLVKFMTEGPVVAREQRTLAPLPHDDVDQNEDAGGRVAVVPHGDVLRRTV